MTDEAQSEQPPAQDRLAELAESLSVSRGRVLIWEREGKRVCLECRGPVIVVGGERPVHVDFRVSGHRARLE